MTDDIGDDEFRLMLKGITRQRPSCLANDSVDIRIMPGKIIWEGSEIEISAPVHARKLGIGMVLQHFSLCETLSLQENIALYMGKDDAQDGSIKIAAGEVKGDGDMLGFSW